jgi:dynein heavy chain
MTGILQTHARKKDKIAIDLLSFSFKILKATFPSEITTCPEHGVYVYGLFIEGARWNTEEVILEDQEVQLSASAGLR